MVFFQIDLGLPLFFSLFFRVVCLRPIAACFVTNLLRWVVVLSTVNFFMVFTLRVPMVKFDMTESSYHIMFINMLQI